MKARVMEIPGSRESADPAERGRGIARPPPLSAVEGVD
jgi:hypothetical protein